MKRINAFALIILLLLLLCGCSSDRYVTPSQAEVVFQSMQDALEEKLHTIATDCTVSYAPVHTTRKLLFPLSESEELYVRFSLQGAQGSDEKGMIYFEVTDHVSLGTDMVNHDYSSFLSAIQVLSAKELDEETLKEFVLAKEEEYPATAYGLYGAEDTLAYKMKALDFWETWVLSQERTTTYEEIAYGGIAKSIDQ